MASGDISVRFRNAMSILLVLPIRFYQRCISPLLPQACRYYPTCSEYACTAIHRHGPLRGLKLATKRIFSCHPWGEGGMDPVPEKNEA